ncbi:hypothetical protein PAECIP112173_00051 [Paenibacillus sp. JJ-100]|uniref:hypothetical protein n=1 Tax=Paenibacillus sp. JJ-100 TaxID=2974896 RepID=UPI0022FF8DD9|nr:hypothetical protein PAECIP112173_00051 [Paenibacillus sp. JJ-100]
MDMMFDSGIGFGFGIGSLISIFVILVNLLLYGLGAYALILFIRLAKRGIQALDIYLYEKRGGRY